MQPMTQSKIIQQADEQQQFEQNPQYFNRNVNYDQVCFNIGNVSRDVDVFISKLRITNKNISQNSSNNEMQKQTTKQYRITKQKSQIDQINSNTQSLVQDLSWIHSSSTIRKKSEQTSDWENVKQRKLKQKNKEQLSSKQQKGNFMIRAFKSTEPTDRIPLKKVNKTVDIVNLCNNNQNIKIKHQSKRKKPSQIINSVQLKNSIQLKNSQTYNIHTRKYTQVQNKNISAQRSYQIERKNNVNKIFFDKFQNKNYDQFDEQQTVVNQPIYNGRRKYFSKGSKDLSIKQTKGKQGKGSEKITKKKLFLKIQQLQEALENIRKQKNISSTTINSKQLMKHSLKQAMKQAMAQTIKKTDTFLKDEKYSFKPSNIKAEKRVVSSSNRTIKDHKLGQDQKISLSKWAQNLW